MRLRQAPPHTAAWLAQERLVADQTSTPDQGIRDFNSIVLPSTTHLPKP
jgi:hypothetical protein